MRPRDDLAREFASLVVWWALWSLWDEYLLDFTPLFELAFLAALGAYHGARRLCERRALARRRQWSTAWLSEADGELPVPAPPPAPSGEGAPPAPARISRI